MGRHSADLPYDAQSHTAPLSEAQAQEQWQSDRAQLEDQWAKARALGDQQHREKQIAAGVLPEERTIVRPGQMSARTTTGTPGQAAPASGVGCLGVIAIIIFIGFLVSLFSDDAAPETSVPYRTSCTDWETNPFPEVGGNEVRTCSYSDGSMLSDYRS